MECYIFERIMMFQFASISPQILCTVGLDSYKAEATFIEAFENLL